MNKCREGGTVDLRWQRRYRLGRSYGVGMFRCYGQRVMRSYSTGSGRRAYRLGVALMRYAIRRGDQALAARMGNFVATVGEMAELPTDGASIMSLEQSAHQAAAREEWALAVEQVSGILMRHPRQPAARGRALGNLATGLHTMGNLQEALAAYDAFRADHAAWTTMAPNFRVGFALSREAVQWYLGQAIDVSALEAATHDFNRAPYTWMIYWWVMGHLSWQLDRKRIRGVRQSSIRTFDQAWSFHYDRALWGLDLLGASTVRDADRAEQRVRLALNDPLTVQLIGRSGWFDLYGDWLEYLMLKNPLRAEEEGQRLALWCLEHGFDGWAAYWRERILETQLVGLKN